MHLHIIWDNPVRSLIDRAEFGKGMSFKNKLGFKPANLIRSVEIPMPNAINMTWKRELERAVGGQFQMNRKATIYVTNVNITESHFVVSARNAKDFSNKVANGVLRLRARINNKLTLNNIIDEGYKPHKKLA